MVLNRTQLETFENDGFLIIPNFVGKNTCDELIREAERLVSQFEPTPTEITLFSTQDQERTTNDYFMNSGDQIRFFFEPNAFDSSGQFRQDKNLSINKIGHALHDLNPIFSQFSRQEKLAQICNQLGYSNPLLMQSMYIFKQPRIGGEVTCHQDGTFLYTEPMSVLGLWFALQDANTSNGCLYALPGGHRIGLKRRFKRNQKGNVSFEELDTSPWPAEGFVPIEAPQGSLVLLHSLLPHLSGPNVSDQSRHAYTLHIVDGNAKYLEDNWLQRRPEMPAQGFTL